MALACGAAENDGAADDRLTLAYEASQAFLEAKIKVSHSDGVKEREKAHTMPIQDRIRLSYCQAPASSKVPPPCKTHYEQR